MRKYVFGKAVKNANGWYIPSGDYPYRYLTSDGDIVNFSDTRLYWNTEVAANSAREKYNNENIIEVKLKDVCENEHGWFVVTSEPPFLYLRASGKLELYNDRESIYFKTEQEALDALAKYNGDYKMKKSDLKTGMIVELSDGEKRLVIANTLLGLKAGSGGIAMRYINDDLTLDSILHGDIVKVYSEPQDGRADYIGSDISWFIKNDCTKYSRCIWEREEPKDITVAEIEEILGYKIKIVGE